MADRGALGMIGAMLGAATLAVAFIAVLLVTTYVPQGDGFSTVAALSRPTR